MPRPSRNQDLLLIETAKKLLPKTGVSGMSVKALTTSCGVNLGMFHYHFKSKAEFTRRVMESVRDEAFQDIAETLPLSVEPIERFRAALLRVGRMSRDNRKLLASFLQDVLNREPEAARFIASTAKKVITVIAPLIQECQRSGEFEDLPFHLAMSFCMSAIHMPNIAIELASRLPAKDFKISEMVHEQILSDQAIEKRVALVIKAMRREIPRPTLNPVLKKKRRTSR